MGDSCGQGRSRIRFDDQAFRGPGFPVIPVDIQPSLVDVPQLHSVPRIMPNGQQFTDSDEEILAAYEHHVALQVTSVIEAPTEVLHRNDGAQALIMQDNQQLTKSDE